jgi:abequosyltransferase
MSKPFLSICIPTFNRASCLKQCLDSIVLQFEDSSVKESVEVIISDNASVDQTESVAKEFISANPGVHYFKNEKNLGVDKNIILSVGYAHGDYVWFLGDDDALLAGSLSYMLKELKQGKFKYCVVNCWGYDNSLNKLALNHPNLDIKTDRYYSNPGKYLKTAKVDKNVVGLFCGLSVQIFDRRLWEALPSKEEYVGTNAVHLFILLTVMKEQSFALIAKPLVKVRADNIRWDVFPNLSTVEKRNAATYFILNWIMDFYGIPHSKFILKIKYYKDIVESYLKIFVRKKILRSQSSRDALKKLLGKL